MSKTPSPPKKPEGSASRQGSHLPRSLNNALVDSEATFVAAFVAGLIGGYETPTDDDTQREAVTPVFQTPARRSEERKCPGAPKRPLKRKGKRKRKRDRKHNGPESKKLRDPKNPPGGPGGAGGAGGLFA